MTGPKRDEPFLVTEFARNDREMVRVTIDEYRGHDVVSIRNFYKAADGEWKPGRGGMAMAVRHLPTLIKALIQAADCAGVDR